MTPAPTLCIVIPVLNEAANIPVLVDRLRAVLNGIAWEAVFVDDDSTDATRDAVRAIGAEDGRVRLLHRFGRRGLSSAFIEGAQASIAPFIAAMDGDLQHDEGLLPAMLDTLRTQSVDVVVGSRYVRGGAVGDWGAARVGMSGLATWLSRLVLRADVADPMSGFFMLPRAVFLRALPRLSAIGFKILLDILASLPGRPQVRELPYVFRARVAGESKLDAGVLLDYALLLADKLVGRVIPVRFLLFAAIGALGLVAHLLILRFALAAGFAFPAAQAAATLGAILGNFLLNNEVTFRDQRLKGARWLRGALVFVAVCGLGAAAQVNIAFVLLQDGQANAGLVGAAMSLVWNYAVGSTLTWPRR